MSCAALYTEQLRARGYRMTPQRMAILHVLHHSSQHLTPSEVYQQAQAALPGLTEPTVYRTLEFLAENGLAMPAHVGSGKLVYEIAGTEHHHLICRGCGAQTQISHEKVFTLYTQIESESGFQLTGSHLTFFGLCPQCQNNQTGD